MPSIHGICIACSSAISLVRHAWYRDAEEKFWSLGCEAERGLRYRLSQESVTMRVSANR
jgi:hypothetical protein